MTRPSMEEVARGLGKAQRRLLMASEPGGWGRADQATGVEIRGSDYRVARSLEAKGCGTFTHGSPISDLYFNSDFGLAVRAYLERNP